MELQLLMMRRNIRLLLFLPLLVACEKEITVDLPETEDRVVVEGTIETGQPPIVTLSWSQGYFDPTDISSIAASFISEAVVTVFDGNMVHVLDRICSDQIPDSLLEQAAAAIGIDAELLANANICVWTKLDNSLLGVDGTTYALQVETNGRSLGAVTTIPHAVGLDSLWFRLAQQQANDDSLGFIWAHIVDPDTIGNQYRWFAQRINAGEDGEPKDAGFVAPFFSVFEDRYANGLSYDFNYNRGAVPYSDAEDDNNEESGYFKRFDTVVVKFVSLDLASYRFYNSFQNNVASQGDLFNNPSNVTSNIQGGLGVWAGYGAWQDTVVCIP